MMASNDREDISQEVDILESIYIDELKISKNKSDIPQCIEIVLHPATADQTHEQYVCLTLVIYIPEAYPDALPSIEIKNPRGISEEYVNSLKISLLEHAAKNQGLQMLFMLIENAKESLTHNNTPSCDCAVCLTGFQSGDEFTKTECYHYFHVHCLERYIDIYTKDQEQEAAERDKRGIARKKKLQIVCPVCREPIAYCSPEFSNRDEHVAEDKNSYEPDHKMKEWQGKMKKLYQKQKAQGGIIDVEAESNRFLLDISTAVTALTIPSLTTSLTSRLAPMKNEYGRNKPRRREKDIYRQSNRSRRGRGEWTRKQASSEWHTVRGSDYNESSGRGGNETTDLDTMPNRTANDRCTRDYVASEKNIVEQPESVCKTSQEKGQEVNNLAIEKNSVEQRECVRTKSGEKRQEADDVAIEKNSVKQLESVCTKSGEKRQKADDVAIEKNSVKQLESVCTKSGVKRQEADDVASEKNSVEQSESVCTKSGVKRQEANDVDIEKNSVEQLENVCTKSEEKSQEEDCSNHDKNGSCLKTLHSECGHNTSAMKEQHKIIRENVKTQRRYFDRACKNEKKIIPKERMDKNEVTMKYNNEKRPKSSYRHERRDRIHNDGIGGRRTRDEGSDQRNGRKQRGNNHVVCNIGNGRMGENDRKSKKPIENLSDAPSVKSSTFASECSDEIRCEKADEMIGSPQPSLSGKEDTDQLIRTSLQKESKHRKSDWKPKRVVNHRYGSRGTRDFSKNHERKEHISPTHVKDHSTNEKFSETNSRRRYVDDRQLKITGSESQKQRCGQQTRTTEHSLKQHGQACTGSPTDSRPRMRMAPPPGFQDVAMSTPPGFDQTL